MHALVRRVGIFLQRRRQNARLLVDFLQHVMAVAALIQLRAGIGELAHRPLHQLVLLIANRHLAAFRHCNIAVFEISHARGERRQRHGVGADIGFRLAVADGDGGAAPRGNKQPVLARKQNCQRKRAA